MRRHKTTLATAAMLLGIGSPVFATSVTFTFDTQTINGTTITGLSSGAGSTQIQAYMNAVLSAAGCAGCSAVVLNSGSSNAVADQTYNGDSHVTGPGTGSKSLTLGTSNGVTASNSNSTVNGSYDTFIANTNDSSSQLSQQITVQFKNITGLSVNSFDYEVFPDGNCTALTSSACGGSASGGHYPNQPDLEFEAGNNTNGSDSLVTTFWGVTPGTSDGNATHSPNSGSGSTEKAPQAIGAWTGNLTGVSELDFVDWPATIGIDNLNVSFTTPSPVPEPTGMILLGTAVGALLLKNRRNRSSKKPSLA